jgi:transposase-like protein
MENQENQTREEQMFSLIEKCNESGLSNKQFCEEYDLPQHLFYYWQNKHRSKNSEGEAGFVPVNLNGRNKVSGSIEIHYPNGVRLQLPEGTGMSMVKSLIGLI